MRERERERGGAWGGGEEGKGGIKRESIVLSLSNLDLVVRGDRNLPCSRFNRYTSELITINNNQSSGRGIRHTHLAEATYRSHDG